ncbi:amylo-alpha-1,6-glucosidase [Autumnicola edwardsiae]|uniref:Trehalase-like protein n=1 Tax=Autumnicola edwardsiae TaxID=3075594 RepID=A0ABU3CYR1_9FLAO|nr:trehalase-like protein [Zunongwangia sp. F297]MDT0651025.1 trehalase-like protein [Zunongwangia sp. F297]
MTNEMLFKETRKIIHENMIKKQRDGKTDFHYTKPSPERYPYQFFWDTCFHVFILNALGEHDMAKEHILSLFSKQEDNGFVGHMIYWDRLKPGRLTDFFQSKFNYKNFYKSHMSSLVQPPMAAQAVERIFEATGDKAFLQKMLPKLKKYYRWFAENRDFDGDRLLTIISPFESGMDWKPTYDVVLGRKNKKAAWDLMLKVVNVDVRNFLNNYDLDRIYEKGYFLVKDVGFNTIYTCNLQSMANICKILEDPEAEEFSLLQEEVTAAILGLMYNKEDKAFYDLHGKNNIQIKVLTPTIFYPVVLKDIPEEIKRGVLQTHFFDSKEFDAEFPIPSVAKNDPSFDPSASVFIWRGPTWIVNNWFLHGLLIKQGHKQESEKLIKSIRRLIEKSGFREYYNPFTGEGYGAKDFTWAGLITDMIRMEEEEKEEQSCRNGKKSNSYNC